MKKMPMLWPVGELGHHIQMVWGRKAKGGSTWDRGELLGYDTTLETGKEPQDVIQTDNTRKRESRV